MKSSLAAYAATTPIVPVGGVEAFSKSIAGALANFSIGGSHAAAGAFVPSTMAPA